MKVTVCILTFIVTTSQFSKIQSNNKHSHIEKVPGSIWEASNFISEFHQRKFVEDAFQKVSQPYLTSLSDEDMPDINVVNTLASVISNELIDRPRLSSENETQDNNTSHTATPNEEDAAPKYLAVCDKYEYEGSPVVEVVNLKRFDEILVVKSNITYRTTPAPCVLLLFYAHTCPFSAMAAPHFNALARAFPTIKMIAINTKKFQIVNSQFGIVGVPTVMLFHNGRPALKFNRRNYTLAQFSKFITQCTGIVPDPRMFVASVDFGGPLPGVPKQESDYFLPLSYAVLAAWFIKFLMIKFW